MTGFKIAPTVVVVTGAGGFVGTEVTRQLLERGYTVRATVRDKQSSSVAHLGGLGEALPGTLEIVEADLSVDGSFDKAIKGATFVFHTASPAYFGVGDAVEDQKHVIDPAVHGTTAIMRAAARANVKRVVITSSIVAMHAFPMDDLPLQTTESWNTTSTAANGPYLASKAQAEQAAWKLAKELNVSLVTILPSLILGPVMSRRGGYSVDTIVALAKGGPWDAFYLTPPTIDVRDVATAHIRAAEIPSASGRYILSSSKFANLKEVKSAVEAAFPTLSLAEPKSLPDKTAYDTSKVEKELGMQLIPVETSVVDQVRTSVALQLGMLD